jgi:RNA polymerase sigma-70 factor (ECF subfamily)
VAGELEEVTAKAYLGATALTYPFFLRLRIPGMDLKPNTTTLSPLELDATGLFDARYRAFLETITHLRPRLHRYCARMTGSVMEGEDVMQEAVFEAYRKLDQFDDSRALGPWLFRIAHNRCIDFLRRRGVREEAEAAAAEPALALPSEPLGQALSSAVERLVIHLPPKERACVLLTDVFDYSLDETAELVGSTVGGVKAALSRGRTKLAVLPKQARAPAVPAPELLRVLQLYIERFNRQDWDGLRELISADARLRVADCFAGRFGDSPYLAEYKRNAGAWRMALGTVDGETVALLLTETAQGWVAAAPVRFVTADGRVESIVDFCKCPWVLEAAESVVVS